MENREAIGKTRVFLFKPLIIGGGMEGGTMYTR